jgi:hypothetical protein
MRTILWLAIAGSVVTLVVSSAWMTPGDAAWAGLNATGGVVLLVASILLPFAGGGFGRSRSLRGAPVGIGTVVSARRTGLTINDRPQLDIALDVATPDGHLFRGVARHLVDLTDLSAVVPGATLPVRYRPDGGVALAVDASPAELRSVYNLVQLARGHLDAHGLRIAEHGLDTRAVVLAMRPTGELRGDRSVLDLTLRVTRPDGSTFDVYTPKAVPPPLVPLVQPGSVIAVKYLPGDESTVALALPMRS